MAKKTSINEALEILEKYNFVLLSEFNSSKDYIKIMDSEGYFYHTTLDMFKRIEKTGSIPFRFSVSQIDFKTLSTVINVKCAILYGTEGGALFLKEENALIVTGRG